MPNLTDDIRAILEQWKGANGGIYATNGCALELAEFFNKALAYNSEALREAVLRGNPLAIGMVKGLNSLIKETDHADTGN